MREALEFVDSDDLITAAEWTAYLSQAHVRAGDLITAAQWNALVAAVQTLETRLRTLEDTSVRLEITDLRFTSPLRVGSVLTIVGRNFISSEGEAGVTIGGFQVSPIRNTFAPERIDVVVPAAINPPAAGKEVQVLVSNVRTNATRRVTVLPRVIDLTGRLAVVWQGVEPDIITPGGEVIWEYTAASNASRPETFTIQPRIEPEGLIDLNALELRDTRGDLIPDGAILLDPQRRNPIRFSVVLPEFPQIDDETEFTLQLEMLVGGVVYESSDPERFTVGARTEDPDPDVDLSIASAIDHDSGDNVLTETNILTYAGGDIDLQLLATFESENRWELLEAVVDGWIIGLDGSTDFEISQQELDAQGGLVQRTINYLIAPSAGAAEATMTVTFQRADSPLKQEITLILHPV